MLAVNRTDKVIGRIIFLTISITNMKLIKGKGVPIGIVWINICFVICLQAKIIIKNHIENANVNEILIWAVGVKMKGNRAIKFKIKINVKIVLMKGIIPLGALDTNAFISVLILFNNKYFLLIKNLNFRINKIGVIILIHTKLNNDEEGSKIEKRFIISFKIL